jgi:hypothetical protein
LRRGWALLEDTSAIDLPQNPFPDISPVPYLVLFGVGIAIGALGHLYRVRFLIALGILLVMIATVVMPVAVVLTR